MNKEKNVSIRLTLLWIFAVILYFIANLQKVVVPGALFNELQSRFNTTAGDIAGVGAAFMYAYAFSTLLLGLFVDRYGGARVMAWGGLALCLGGILSAAAPALWILYCARILTAAGAASIYLSVTKETARIYPGNFALMLGFAMVGGYLGGMAGNTPFIAASERFGWVTALLAAGLASTVVYLLFVGIKSTVTLPPVVKTATFSIKRFAEVSSVGHNWRIIICGAFPFGLYFAVQSIFGKKFLEDFSGLTADEAGWILTALMVIGAVNSLLAPWTSRLLGNRRKPLMIFSGMGTALAFGLILSALFCGIHTPWLAGGAFVLLAFAGNISPVIVALIRETNSSDIWGVMLSFYGFIAYIVTAIIGHAAGLLMELFPPRIENGIHLYGTHSWLAVFSVLFLVSLASAGGSVGIRETFGKNEYGEAK